MAGRRDVALGMAIAVVLLLLTIVIFELGRRLDERFSETRFVAGGVTDGCPIAVWRDVSLPMCRPIAPGW